MQSGALRLALGMLSLSVIVVVYNGDVAVIQGDEWLGVLGESWDLLGLRLLSCFLGHRLLVSTLNLRVGGVEALQIRHVDSLLFSRSS